MKYRLVWADSLKGLLMLFVVLGHAIQYTLGNTECENNHLWNCIYSFHMPAFMAVSGYLCYRMGGGGKNRLKIVYRRFLQLLVPYFLWEVIYILTNGINTSSIVNIFLHPYFWFLWVLFFINISFQFGDWLAEKFKVYQEVVIIAIGLIYMIVMVLGEVRILGIQFIAYYYMFYVFGYYMHKYPKVTDMNNGLLVVLVAVWGIMAWFWKMHELPFFLNSIPLPTSLMQYAYRFLTGFIAVYILICLSPKVLDGGEVWNEKLVEFGQISLGIYVVHLLLIPYITQLSSQCISNSSLAIIVSFMIACVISIVIVSLLNKWKITARLLLGKV